VEKIINKIYGTKSKLRRGIEEILVALSRCFLEVPALKIILMKKRAVKIATKRTKNAKKEKLLTILLVALSSLQRIKTLTCSMLNLQMMKLMLNKTKWL
jgi:hypothetical protein